MPRPKGPPRFFYTLPLYSTVSASKKRLGAENLPDARASKPVQWTGRVDHGHQRACYRRIAVSPDAYTRVSSFVNLSRSRLNNSPIFLRFLRAVDNLDRLPRCGMQVLAGTEDPIQHAAYGA